MIQYITLLGSLNEITWQSQKLENKSKSIILGMNHYVWPTRNNLILAVLGVQMSLTYSYILILTTPPTTRLGLQDLTHWWLYPQNPRNKNMPFQRENLGDGSQAIRHICKLQASGRAQVTRKFPGNLRCNITSNVETSETSNNWCLSCF